MSEPNEQRATEYYGLGQSGYTAGRVGGDPSLRFEARNISYPPGEDARVLQEGDDERFIGTGGLAWVPDDAEEPMIPGPGRPFRWP